MLTNDTFRNETSSCSQGKLNVTIGDYYDYTVTVNNFLGNSSISDSISKFLSTYNKNVGQETKPNCIM